MSVPIFVIPVLNEGDSPWFWQGKAWRDFLAMDEMQEFPLVLGRPQRTTKRFTPYMTFALYVRVVIEDVSEASRALLLIANRQLARESECGTLVIRYWPMTSVEPEENDQIEVHVHMRYVVEKDDAS